MDEKPFIAIWMVTYNHEAYIADAIESILIQQTEYKYKIFIGEDCSTDKTREICISYQKKYPDRISLRLNGTNLGANSNAVKTYNECFASGAKYIAILEGDDYWTDPLKLQQQITLLESKPEISFCAHASHRLINNHLELIPNALVGKKIYNTADILYYKWFMMTSGFVFRASAISPLPDWFANNRLKHGDLALCLLSSLRGPGYYIEKSMSVYRDNSDGLMKKMDIHDTLDLVQMIDNFNRHSGYQFEEAVKKYKQKFSGQIAWYYYSNAAKHKKLSRLFWSNLKAGFIWSRSWKQLIKLILKPSISEH